jgi:lysozyme family protein
MASVNLPALVSANSQRWATARFSKAMFSHSLDVAQKHLCEPHAKAIYKKLEVVTGIPWWVIALIHWREAAGSWKANIANGQRYDRITTEVPKGRGPFQDFTQAALDALEKCPPYAARWKNWQAGGALTLLELYNGEGYELYHHMASPYLWSGSQHYIRGKYDADGHFNSTMVDSQLGCAILLRAMMDVDGSILAPSKPKVLPKDGEDAGNVEIDPSTFPEGGAEGEAHPPSPSEDAPEIPAEPEAKPVPKPLSKSKISNAQIVTGVGGATIALGQANDALREVAGQVSQTKDSVAQLGLTDVFAHAATKPMFLIGAAILVLAGLTIYWRWKDHGRGQG